MLNIFEFSQVKEIAESWLVSGNKFLMNHQLKFLDEDNKTKLEPPSISDFLEVLGEKNKF